MSLLEKDGTLPGNVHPSGLIVVALLLLAFFWYKSHSRALSNAGIYSSDKADIGYGGGVNPPDWNGDAFQFDDEVDTREGAWQAVVRSRHPEHTQPQVIRGGGKVPWYRYLDQYDFRRQRKPYLEKRSYP